MKNLILFLALFISNLSFGQNEVLGKWITVDDKTGVQKSVIEVYEKEGRYFGKVTKMMYRSEEERCTRCEGTLKNQLVKGMDVLWDFKYRKRSKTFGGGKLLNPESGKTYNGQIWVENGNLMVRGYISFFYRTQVWIPYKE